MDLIDLEILVDLDCAADPIGGAPCGVERRPSSAALDPFPNGALRSVQQSVSGVSRCSNMSKRVTAGPDVSSPGWR
jgi:hypothetical protein